MECVTYVQEYAFGTQDAFDILTLIYILPMRLLVVTMLMVSFSITYGSPPSSHLWTYVADLNEVSTGKYFQSECSCSTNNTGNSPIIIWITSYSSKFAIQLIGKPVIPCGMVCSVKEMRDLVAIIQGCPGLSGTHQALQLPTSMCTFARIKSQRMRILE